MRDLRRIAAFSAQEGELPFGRLRANLVAAAREALAKIDGGATGSQPEI